MPQTVNATWLMPVKNGMPFLSEALQSIERQTLSGAQVLVWDNGSTDGTVEELHRWIPSRLPGKVFSDQPMELSDSRMALLEAATTEFVLNLDADDISDPTRLERQLAYMEAHPNVTAASCHFQWIDESGKPNGRPVELPLEQDEIINKLLDPSPLCNSAAIMRRDAVLAVGYPKQLGIGEDYDLWLRLAKKSQLGNVDFIGLLVRRRDSSTIRIAAKANTLRSQVAEAVAPDAAELFGISVEEFRRLYCGSLSFSLPLILRIATHLDKTYPGKRRLSSLAFIRAVRSFVRKSDLATKLVLGAARALAK